MTKDEMAKLQLGLDVLQSIRAQLQDFQTKFDTLFYMTEKHQQEVRELLKTLQR